jgi:hypothetical protein
MLIKELVLEKQRVIFRLRRFHNDKEVEMAVRQWFVTKLLYEIFIFSIRCHLKHLYLITPVRFKN